MSVLHFIRFGPWAYSNCHVFVIQLLKTAFFFIAVFFHSFLFHICRMFAKLKKHWKVNGINLALIITTFALGGSLCGYVGRQILLLLNLEKNVGWFLLYIILITLLWPLCVLLISIPLGQYGFFKKYVLKVLQKITGNSSQTKPVSIAIFASGNGSNAKAIITYFKSSDKVKIALIVCNRPDAGVLTIAKENAIPTLLITREQFFNGDHFMPHLEQKKIDFIVLAGFLWKIPADIVKAYPKKIVNIHPALLPKYGGIGMYGHAVHEAVIAAGEKETGITIHYVDALYDHGEIIFQAKCLIEENDNAVTISQKINTLELANFPGIIENIIVKG